MKKENSYEYRMGYDAAINGADTRNCNFGIFATPAGKQLWEEGNRAGLKAKDTTTNLT